LSLKHNCEQKKAIARIRYLKAKKEKTFELCKTPNISLSDISFSVDPVARPKQRKDVVIKNRSAFAVENMQISIEITSAEENNKEEVANWFSFSNAAEPKNVRSVAMIGAKETIREPLEVTVPIWAKAETIYGNIVVNAPFLKEPKKAKLTLVITKTPRVELKASISSSKVNIYSKEGIPQEITVKVAVINNSDLAVENIDIEIENRDECSHDWLRPLDTLSIARIEPKKSASIALIASAPKDAQKNDVMRCILKLSYENPLPPNDIKEQNVGFVEITKR
ncbi:MAG: hypothetical protein J7L44_02045, partial [Candidatus Diapherotrites archaeon]|nr:hypothetical protein [Candidatus Diapherotrites archaeon]